MTADADFAELYRTHYRRVFGLCRQVLGSADRAQDAAQEVFIRAHRGFRGYDPAQPFAGWILRIASNYCIDIVRRRKTEARLFGSEADERSEAEAENTNVLADLLTKERAAEVRAAVDALPERYRLPLVLAYYGDSNHDEVAAALGITRTHVGTLIFRAKQMLRRALEKEAAP
jgi:RNA polymerase sigma-70 factor (ECF subfamily)